MFTDQWLDLPTSHITQRLSKVGDSRVIDIRGEWVDVARGCSPRNLHIAGFSPPDARRKEIEAGLENEELYMSFVIQTCGDGTT